MKSKMFKITAIVMMMAGCISSCGKRNEVGGEILYKPCPCEYGDEPKYVTKGNVLLYFDDDFKGSANEPRMEYKDGLVRLILMGEDVPHRYEICNFPEFAKQWRDLEEVTVYYEGVVYPACEDRGYRWDAIYGNLVLTKLKIN